MPPKLVIRYQFFSEGRVDKTGACLGVKKKYLWFRFPTDPIFFCRPYYFFNAIDRATLFSLGGARNHPEKIGLHGQSSNATKMASVVTLIIEKNIQKKNYFRPTDPNFFAR
jgi:hypothetical protein